MFYRYLLITLLTLFCHQAIAAVFVVTSNADSGPGTLREALALAAANDSTQTDHINFNLPDISEAGRTIKIFSELPDLSSNLIIDGSTQPGTKFGVSDARVQLLFQIPVLRSFSGLRSFNHHNVTIYGLYINLLTNVNPPSNAYLFLYNGIELKNTNNVQIGAAGKGNVVDGFYYPIAINSPDTIHHQVSFFCENLAIKSNIFGIATDGKTLSANQVINCGLYYVTGKVDIGGTIQEGNLFPQGFFIYQVNSYDSTSPNDYYFSNPAVILIKNNKVGVDYDVENAIKLSKGINVSTGAGPGKSTVNIEDNVIAADGDAITIENIGRKVNIIRNFIGTDKTRQKSFPVGGTGIFMYINNEIAIGSSDIADANYITNCNPVWVFPYTNTTINKNSFYCLVNPRPVHDLNRGSFDYPVIAITKVMANAVGGTATPNAVIELFYSDACKTCAPQTYFASTKADANGTWQYSGTLAGTVIASATYGKNTSDFTQTSVNTDGVNITNACNGAGGAIKGVLPLSAAVIQWVDEKGNVVGSNADLTDVPAGKYKLIVKQGDCSAESPYYEIFEALTIHSEVVVKKNTSCNGSDGYIKGITATAYNPGQPVFSWKDANGTERANTADLTDVIAGSYTLTVTTADKGCSQTYGPVILKNTTGPTIDDSKPAITNTNCGQTIGSIKNIIITGGTGTRHFTWKNSQQQEVGNTQDLTGQPAGKYTLQVTDDSSCGPIYSKEIDVAEVNGVTITESTTPPTPASCGKANGAVTGVTATGGTKYEWRDVNGNLVGTSLNLNNVPGGAYQLTVSNAFCGQQSKVYQVGQQSGTVFPSTYTVNHIDACYGAANGALQVNQDILIAAVRWVNVAGVNVAMHHGATGLPTGDYKLYLTDQNGCESYYNTYHVDELPEYKVASYGEKNDEQCGLKNANVNSVALSGGLPPYTYKWLDAGGAQIALGNSISNLAAGTYTLNVVDSRCGNVDITYKIQNLTQDLPAPSLTDLQVCSPGEALLLVNNATANAVYRIYDRADSPSPLSEETGGHFKIAVTTNRSFFVSQASGTCESPKVEVKISVGLSTVSIANSFTPNGDGHNDYWKVNGIENYPAAVVQIFNRNGTKLFESKGYTTPFNGTYNGKPLPVGTYYYIINLNKNCNLLSGSLTILR